MAGLNLDNKPWYWAAVVGAVVAGGLVFACEQYWFKGIREDITNRTNELEVLKQKVREGKVAEGRLPQFREEAERLETELQRLLRILPTAKQTDEIIKKVKSLTERGNFRFTTFQPQAFVKKDFYTEWPISVQLDGGYHDLALFFDRLSRFSRIVNIESLKVNASARPKLYTITSAFTMKTFIYGDVTRGGAAQ
jgi:Tfp pilus assembly protein PilO